MKHLFLFSFFLISISIHSQSLYIEGLGKGFVNSINYEHNLNKQVDGFNVQLGLGYAPESFFSIPLSLNYVLGEKNHHLEIGGGLTYGGGTLWLDDDEFERTVSMHANLLYRYQNFDKPLFFKFGLTPFFNGHLTGGLWIGAGIGFKFGK